MAYNGKTNWQNNEIVDAADMNRIEQGILDNDNLLYLVKTIFPTISSSNVFTVTISSGSISSMSDLIGVPLKIKADADSSSAVSLQINSFSAYSLKKSNGNDVTNLKANGIYTVVWNGVNFQLLGEGGEYGTVTQPDVLEGVPFGTEDGIKLGTMPDNGPDVAETINLTTQNQEYTIEQGFHSGLRKIKAVISGLVAGVIKAGTTVGGILGTFTNDATATASQMLAGATAWVKGVLVTGTIPSKGAATITPGTTNQTIAAGRYLSGAQTIKGDVNLKAANIKSGVNIFGVAGTLAPFVSTIASIQRGIISKAWEASETSFTQAISAVDLNRTIIELRYNTDTDNTQYNEVYVAFNSNTQLGFTRKMTASTNADYEWEVIQFNSGVLKSNVQRGQLTVGTSDVTTYDVTISSVDITKSKIVFSKNNRSGLSQYTLYTAQFINSTTIRFTRKDSSGAIRAETIAWQVVEFK